MKNSVRSALQLVAVGSCVVIGLSACTSGEAPAKTPVTAVAADAGKYTFEVNQPTQFYENAYSYASISVRAESGAAKLGLVQLPTAVAPDELTQSVFQEAPQQKHQDATDFDVFFPLGKGLNKVDLVFYPEGMEFVDGQATAAGVPYTLELSGKKTGSALLLGQENKLDNARVVPIDSNVLETTPAEYTWFGRTTPDLAADKVEGAVAHFTELHTAKLIEKSTIQSNGETLTAYPDASRNGKLHMYAFTNAAGEAKVRITPPNEPVGGELVYWPFADNTSEVAHIVVYDDVQFGPNLPVAVPITNPVYVSDKNPRAHTTFVLDNTAGTISDGGTLYIVINDEIDSSMPSSSDPTITLTPTNQFVEGSPRSGLPKANNIRYVYVDSEGTVQTSRRFSFFGYND